MAARLAGLSTSMHMKVAVWDTYVTRKDGGVMHFDIIAPATVTDSETIHAYGHEYLRRKGQEGQPLTARECTFCHMEQARPEWEAAILRDGHYIYEMENCH